LPGSPRGHHPSLAPARPGRPGRVLDPGGAVPPLAPLRPGGSGPLPIAGPEPAGLGRTSQGDGLRTTAAPAAGVPAPVAAGPHLVARARLAADRRPSAPQPGTLLQHSHDRVRAADAPPAGP